MTFAEEAQTRADEHGIVFKAEVRGKVETPAEPEPEEEYVPPVERTDVRIHRLTIEPHPNADKLELAVVGGYRAIVPKGQYQTGDYALYIPEASILPEELIEKLGVRNYLHKGNRVRAARLRGVVSQGIVCRPERVTESNCIKGDWKNAIPGDELLNWAETLGIIKHVPRVPAHFRGKVKPRGSSRILPWIEISNIKKIMGDFVPGELVVATEKIHGTHCMITWDTQGNDGGGELLVSSKGIGKQGWDLIEDPTNVYWRAVRENKLEEVLRWIAENVFPDVERVGLYGEVYGPGIQDLTYDVEPGRIEFVAFDVRLDDMWLNSDRRCAVLSEALRNTGAGAYVRQVPELYYGPYDYDTLVAIASGRTYLGNAMHIREGLVVRPVIERFRGDGSRVIAKFISDDYLLRDVKTATEFE